MNLPVCVNPLRKNFSMKPFLLEKSVKSRYDNQEIFFVPLLRRRNGVIPMPADILASIQNRIHTFSKGQKKIASYILSNYDKAAFMTASRLGKTVEVSESTVVRFAVELGYAGYPEMQKHLQELVRNKLTSVQRIEVASDQLNNQDVVGSVLQRDANAIRMTSEALDRDQMAKSVEAILRARYIYIVGVRSSAALAAYLNFYFRNIFDNVRLISSTATSEMFEQLLRVGKDDVVIGISLPRYSSRTVKVLQYARASGATVITITDKPEAPGGKVADYVLCAKSNMVSVVDSLVAPMSVINALVVSIGIRQESRVAKTFEDLERLWDEYDAFERVE